jgi:hypothetical protein
MADTWHVVSQRQTSDITADGRFVQVMEVTVETASGTTFSIRVPEAAYDEDSVRQLIEARVAQILAVENL